MAVVARLSVASILTYATGSTVNLQPVVPADDPHDEEIKKFFAATPAGTAEVSGGQIPDAKPGKQYYLYLEHVKGDPATDETREIVAVDHVQLQGWATLVGLKATPAAYPSPWKLSFTIRNEMAAEQFQTGERFYVSLEPVPESA